MSDYVDMQANILLFVPKPKKRKQTLKRYIYICIFNVALPHYFYTTFQKAVPVAVHVTVVHEEADESDKQATFGATAYHAGDSRCENVGVGEGAGGVCVMAFS